jgi:hypothetical protein
MTACADALVEKYRRLFHRGLNQTDRKSRLAKAAAWYLASFGIEKDRKKSLLSFGWIMSELLCEIKLCEQVGTSRFVVGSYSNIICLRFVMLFLKACSQLLTFGQEN